MVECISHSLILYCVFYMAYISVISENIYNALWCMYLYIQYVCMYNIRYMLRYDILCGTVYYEVWYEIAYEMIWYDKVSIMWHATIWYIYPCHNIIWYWISWMLWHAMQWHAMQWHAMLWYDMIWYFILWYDIIWYDVMWYDVIRCDMDTYMTVWHNINSMIW